MFLGVSFLRLAASGIGEREKANIAERVLCAKFRISAESVPDRERRENTIGNFSDTIFVGSEKNEGDARDVARINQFCRGISPIRRAHSQPDRIFYLYKRRKRERERELRRKIDRGFNFLSLCADSLRISSCSPVLLT